VGGEAFELEDSFISFLPNFPEGEARKELPDASENWVLIGERVPIFYGVADVVSVSIGTTHYLRPQIPNRLTVVEIVKKVFHRFLLLLTKGVD
jgi:hypothetical protein